MTRASDWQVIKLYDAESLQLTACLGGHKVFQHPPLPPRVSERNSGGVSEGNSQKETLEEF
jgi:hypothetical protein